MDLLALAEQATAEFSLRQARKRTINACGNTFERMTRSKTRRQRSITRPNVDAQQKRSLRIYRRAVQDTSRLRNNKCDENLDSNKTNNSAANLEPTLNSSPNSNPNDVKTGSTNNTATGNPGGSPLKRPKIEKPEIPKKLHRFKKEEIAVMEKHYREESFWPNRQVREKFGRQFGVDARRVQVWFQNQRAKLGNTKSNKRKTIRLARPLESQKRAKKEHDVYRTLDVGWAAHAYPQFSARALAQIAVATSITNPNHDVAPVMKFPEFPSNLYTTEPTKPQTCSISQIGRTHQPNPTSPQPNPTSPQPNPTSPQPNPTQPTGSHTPPPPPTHKKREGQHGIKNSCVSPPPQRTTVDLRDSSRSPSPSLGRALVSSQVYNQQSCLGYATVHTVTAGRLTSSGRCYIVQNHPCLRIDR